MQELYVFDSSARSGWIYSADTRAKMLICALASVASIIVGNFQGQLVLLTMSFLYTLSLRRIGLICIAYLLVVLMSLAALGFFRIMVWFMPRPTENFELSALLVPFMRLLVMTNVVLPLAFSSRIQAMLDALRSLRLPFCIYLPAAVVFRFLPEFGNDIRQVAESLRLRGYRITPWNLTRHPLLSLRLIFTPLLFRSLRSSEDLGIAAELKGLGCSSRMTPYRRQVWTRADSLLTVLAILTTLAALACGFRFGDKHFMP